MLAESDAIIEYVIAKHGGGHLAGTADSHGRTRAAPMAYQEMHHSPNLGLIAVDLGTTARLD